MLVQLIMSGEERSWLVKIISCLLIFFNLYSCSTVSSVGAVLGNASTSTRGFSASIDDTFLMTKIITKISGVELKNFTNITVSVSHGHVLLAGNVESQNKRLELMKEVWKIEGVKKVYNEMYLGSSQTFSERADDLLFETRIKNRLLFEPGIYSNNYSVDVVNGNVYVMGTASNFDEKTKLENFLREMKDIKKLITIVSLPKKNQNNKNLKNEKKN